MDTMPKRHVQSPLRRSGRKFDDALTDAVAMATGELASPQSKDPSSSTCCLVVWRWQGTECGAWGPSTGVNGNKGADGFGG